MQRAVERPEEMEEAIVSVPGRHKAAVTARARRSVVIDLPRRTDEVAAGMFPLRLVYSPKADEGRMAARVREDDPDELGPLRPEILSQIDGYQVPVIQLTKDATKEAICSVFENVNTRGVVLTVFELLTASYAADSDYEREHGQYFHLPGEWATVRDGSPASNAGAEFDDTDFLRAICLVSTHSPRRGQGRNGPVRTARC